MPLDKKTQNRIFWGNVIVVLIVIVIILYPSFVGPAVQLSLSDPDLKLSGRPGEAVPYQYRITISQTPTIAELNDSWWFSGNQKTLIPDTDKEYRPLPRNVDRIVDDEVIHIPTTYLDPTTRQERPIPCGTWEYRRSVTALTRTGVYRTSVLDIPVEIVGCP